MAVPFIKVYYTRAGVEYDITECTNAQNKRGLQIKDAKTDLTINNSALRYKLGGEGLFVEDGTVEVYADYSPITKATNQLVLSGQIQEIGHRIGENGSQTTLSVSDRTSLLLSGLWSKDYTNTTVDNLIKNVIEHAPSAEGLVTTNNVVATTTAGSAFPSVDMSKVMKPIYEWLTDLSQPEMTGEDKAYLFYVDKDNDLHWFYPSATASASIIEGSTVEIYGAQMRKSQDELVNMIIYNAGADLNGNGILWYKFNPNSKSNKLRMKYQPMIDVARDLLNAEVLGGNLTQSSNGTIPYNGKLYNATYPLTPKWTGATSVANISEYNDAFRTECKVRADTKAMSFMSAFSGLRWKGKLEIKGTADYVAGTLINVHLPTFGILNTKLRVWDVQQSFGTDGWVTGLELREDDGAITS